MAFPNKLTGVLKYDPVAYATGRRRTAKLRPFMEEALDQLWASRESLSPGRRAFIEQLFNERSQTPTLWTTNGTFAIAADRVEKLYRLLLNSAIEAKECPSLTELGKRIERSLIITERRPNWAILEVAYSVIEKSRRTVGLSHGQKPAVSNWGPHITVVRGERCNAWNIDSGREISFKVNPKVQEGRGKYFYLDIQSEELESIRSELGLNPKPNPDFHITVGCIR